MNESQQDLLQKMTQLEEKLQQFENKISLLQQQKEHCQNQFLEVSLELSNVIFFKKMENEVNGSYASSFSVLHKQLGVGYTG